MSTSIKKRIAKIAQKNNNSYIYGIKLETLNIIVMYRVTKLFLYIVSLTLLVSISACGGFGNDDDVVDLKQIKEIGKLRVITLFGPMSYFSYKDNDMGYEYEFARNLCKEIGVEMELIIAPDEETMVDMLVNGEGDLIAYRLPSTIEYKDKVSFTNREYITNQVIVQCKSDSMARDVLDLSGKVVHVKQNTIYADRLSNLNNEIGGGMEIVYAPDSVSIDDLIAQTAMHKISMTIADNDIARLNKTYFGNLNYDLDVSFPQRAAWAVSKNSPELLEYINNWSKNAKKKLYFSQIYRKYFEKSKYFEAAGLTRIPGRNQISSFDDYFRKYASIPSWDWRLLAAVAYKESKFDPQIVSWAGACGLMQLMPNTAISMGMTEDDFHVPELSIKAGAKYIKQLNNMFLSVQDPAERVKFVLASYNSGPGHIFDARALAEKYGKDPNIWYGNVETYIRLKSESTYYTDNICKFGYCRGNDIANYVDVVLSKYEEYKLWARP